MLRNSIIVFICLALPLLVSSAQSSETPSIPHHANFSVVDGSVNPELIPDNTAYRLYFVMTSRPTTPTDSQKYHQHLQLAKVRLTDADEQVAVNILATFYTQYQSLIATYNATATAALARGEEPNVNALRSQRDQLVQSTHDTLQNALSSTGWSLLDAFVQHEKTKMKIDISGGQQQ